MDKAKILSKNPFKMQNKLAKELEVIQKLVDATTKKTEATELADALNSEFESLLLKTKDPVQTWIRGNALEQLGYVDAALLFKAKAEELGYVVESVNTINENAENLFNGTLTFQVWTPLTDPNEVIEYIESIIMSGQADDKLFNKDISVEMNEIEATEEKRTIEHMENTTQETAYDKLVAKYELSDILKSQLATVIEDLDTDRETVLNAVAAITGDTVENIDAVINETHKQQFEYSPQEETKWNLYADDNMTVEKPEYNATALKHMISDDAFLKFSIHNLATNDETKDLDMIYNTYIKGDDEMLKKLKTYESYTMQVISNTIAKDNLSNALTGFIKENNVVIDENIMPSLIFNASNSLKNDMRLVKESYALYTHDVKNEIKTVFNGLLLEDVLAKLTASKINITDDRSIMTEKVTNAFGLSKDAAGFVINAIEQVLSKINETLHIGTENNSKLFLAETAMLILLGLNQPFKS
jgi:hypothetical protein